jgi:hypothetical protein
LSFEPDSWIDEELGFSIGSRFNREALTGLGGIVADRDLELDLELELEVGDVIGCMDDIAVVDDEELVQDGSEVGIIDLNVDLPGSHQLLHRSPKPSHNSQIHPNSQSDTCTLAFRPR